MPPRSPRAGSLLLAALALGAAACAAPQPLCARPPGAGFAYPPGPGGEILAGYVTAFDSGDPAAMRAMAARHHAPRAGLPPAAALDVSYRTMRDTLGCVEPRAVSRRDGGLVLLVETAREGHYEITFALDEAQRVLRVRGRPAMPPGQNEPASIAAAVAAVDAYLAAPTVQDGFSGVVVVADHGRPILSRALGLADRAAGIANRLDTRFNIGSVGKMFTGVAVAQLVEAGKLRFDEPLGEILRDDPLPAARAVTLHQLLTHTSGLGDVLGFLDARPPLRTPADLLARFAKAPLAFAPGRDHLYSNLGFAVLGRVVEVASGEPFDAYLGKHVFAPAGMTETGAPPADPALLAIPYTRRREGGSGGERRDATALVPPPLPFGCERATAMDLVRFGEALFGDKLLRPETVRLVTTAKERPGARHPDDGIEGGYGYGFGEGHLGGVRVVNHDGGTYGVSATLSFLPEAGLTVVVLANDDPPAAPRVGARIVHQLAYVVSHAGRAATP